MPDENAVAVGGNQTSSTTQGNQTSSTQSNQTNDDFVLDFGEGSTSDESESNATDIDENIDSSIESDKQYDEDQKGDENVEGLTDNEEPYNKDDSFSVNETEGSDNLDNDFNISLDDTTDENQSEYDSFDLSGNEEEAVEDDSDFQIDLDSSDEIGSQDNVSETSDNDIQRDIQDNSENEETIEDDVQDNTENEETIEDDIQDNSKDEEVIENDIQDNTEDEETIEDDIDTGDFIVDDTSDSPIENESDNIDEENNMDEISNPEDLSNTEDSDETETIEDSEVSQESDSFMEDDGNTFENLNKESNNPNNLEDVFKDSFEPETSVNDEVSSEENTESMPFVNEISQDNAQDTNDIQDNTAQDNSLESKDDIVKNDDTLSQSLDFDQSKISTQSESPIEKQPSIQDYQDIQPSINDFQPLNENEESNQSQDSLDLNGNTPQEENSFENAPNNSEFQQHSQNISFSLDPQPKQENLVNNENTSNGFYLDSTGSEEVSPNTGQETSTANLMQEEEAPTPINEGANISNETNNTQTIQESSENNVTNPEGAENNVSTQEANQMQPTLSLDQILDSEILSNPKYSDNSVSISGTPTVKQPSHSNKIGAILVGAGIFVLAGLVAVLAFPSGNSGRNPNLIDTGNNVEIIENSGHFAPDNNTDVDFPDPIMSGDSEEDTRDINPGGGVPAIVEFPDPIDDNWDEESDDNQNPVAIPYSGSYNFDYEDEEQEKERLLNDIMASISSFKSQAESYYSYGQEMADKKIIKYASQMIYACDTYDNQISSGEGIDQETFSQFEENVLGIIAKIDNYNNGGDDIPQIIQNNVQTNENDYDFSEKEELKDYIYSR